MKNFTLLDSFKNRTKKTKRWLGLLTFCVMFFLSQSSSAQFAEVTYTAGDIPTLYNTAPAVNSVVCTPGAILTIEVPDGYQIAGLTLEYDMTAWGGAWMSEQRSVLYSPTINSGESTIASGVANNAGTYSYNRNINFANGATGNVDFELKTWRTWGDNGIACGTSYNYVNNNSWTISPVFELIPPCPAPVGLNASVTLSSANLFWISTGDSFDIEWGTSGFTQGSGTTVSGVGNPYELTGLSADTNYQYYVRQNCDNDGYSTWSGPFTFFTGYCDATSVNIGDNINSVVTSGAIVNISNITNGASPNGYGNFTTNAVQHFETGETQFTVVTNWSMRVNIWIDWNNNMTFEADELMYQAVDPQQTHTALISVPLGTPIGDYRIRVRARYDSPPACGSINWGETEDYTFTVITPPTCMPPTQLGANINSLTEAELYWTSEGTLFEVEYGTQGFTLGTGTNVTGITENSTILSGLAENTYHQYFIRRDCGDGDLSPWTGPYTFYTNYCEATSQWVYQYESIKSFTTTLAITNISNNTGDNSYLNGYGDFTDMSASHFETGEVNFTVDTGNFWAVVSIWIDWNNNMTFEESEKVYTSGEFTMQSPFTGMFSVPAGQTVGDYRMRVRASNNGNLSPCGQITYGETEDYTFVVIPTPTCMPPTELGANINSLTEAELFWTSVGDLFEVEYGTQGFTLGTGTTVTGITTSSTILSGLTPNTYHHYYVRRDCGDGDLSPWTGPYTFYTNYCEVSTQWTGDNIISLETSGAILNVSNTNSGTSTNGYGDFTSFAVEHFETGESEFTIKANSSMALNMWIDWNNNMIFDANELVYEGLTGQNTHTFSISVPAGTPTGDYRIRVRAGYLWDSPIILPCGARNYGETEDYTFTVIPTPTCMPPTQLGANINSLTEAELYWTSVGDLFEVEYGSQGFTLGTGTTVTGITTTSTILSGLTQNTYHHYYVRRDCGGGDLSPWTGPYLFYTNYCESTTQYQWDYISSFSTTLAITNISNNSEGLSPNGYGNFTNMSVSHFETGEVSFTLTTNSWFGVNIWVDWNNNMVFEESEKVYTSGNFTAQGPFTGMFSVPVGQAVGDYRMRVRGSNDSGNPSPCGQINYGETEDYTFTVIPTPSCMPPTQLGANINSLTEAELYWTSVGDLFEVEYGTQGFTLGTGTSVTGITTNSTVLSGLTPNTYHHYYIRRDCGDGDLSPWTGPYLFYTNYCEANSQWTGDNINSVVTSGAIVNVSNITNGASPNGYGNFTNNAVQHFETGETQFTVVTNWGMRVNIWIDWNNNMILEDDELMYQAENPQQTHTALISVPVGTPVGSYRIRVRAQYNSPPACGTINYGETEDYTFTVITPPTCMPPTQLGANINSLTEAELYWTSEGNLFEVEYGTQGFTLGTGTIVTGITENSTTLTGLAENTYHQYFIRRDCGDGDLSPWTGPYTFYTNYCEALTQYSGGSITSFVTDGGIPFNISNTNSGGSPNGYGNFTGMSVHHFETGTIDFSLSGSDEISVKMWIDWNNNMIFEDDELITTFTSPWNGSYNGSFSIPLGTPVGDYRIRIRSSYTWSGAFGPCGTVDYGETEDYTLTVIVPPSCLPPFIPTSVNSSATSVTLSWQANGDLFDIEYGPAGFTPGTGTMIPGVGNPYVLSGLESGVAYSYYVRQDCGEEDGLSTWNGPATFTPGIYQGNIPTLVNANPQVGDDACATSFSIDVPEGKFLSALNVKYTMLSTSLAWTSQQRSVLYSPTLGIGEDTVAIGDDVDFSGMINYNRNVTFANEATGTVEFQLKAWRTSGGTGCTTDRIFVMDGTWILSADFEDIPTCPNPPSDLGYTNITEDSLDLVWTAEEGTFQVIWGNSGFDVDQGEGTIVSGITTNSYSLSGLDSSILYEFYVRRDCSTEDGEDFGDRIGPLRFNPGYCIPTSSSAYYFTMFNTTNAVENIVFSYGGPALGTGYKNETDKIIVQNAGETFDFSSNYVATSSGLRIWIDWNNNYVFEDSEEEFYLANGSGSKTGSIAVPEDAVNGDYRMRVRVQEGSTVIPPACGNIATGEAIDFTLRVQNGTNSIVDFNSFAFGYHPNPVSEMLYLKANTEINEVVVFNMLGQQLNLPVQASNTQVDMTGLPSGNYVMSVTIEGVNKTFKVVKK